MVCDDDEEEFCVDQSLLAEQEMIAASLQWPSQTGRSEVPKDTSDEDGWVTIGVY